VKVTPNLEFAKDEFDSKELTELLTAKSLGAPLSLKSIHELPKQKDLTAMDYDDEVAQIAQENEDRHEHGDDVLPPDEEDEPVG
jgi:hypothetical protein